MRDELFAPNPVGRAVTVSPFSDTVLAQIEPPKIPAPVQVAPSVQSLQDSLPVEVAQSVPDPLPVPVTSEALGVIVETLGLLYELVSTTTEVSVGIYNRIRDALRAHFGIRIAFVEPLYPLQRKILGDFFEKVYAHAWHGRFLVVETWVFMLEVYVEPLTPTRLYDIIEGKTRLRHFSDLAHYPHMTGYVHQQLGEELRREGVTMYAADAVYSAVGVLAKQWADPERFLEELAKWARRMQDAVQPDVWQHMVRSYVFFTARQRAGLPDTHSELEHVHYACLLLSVSSLQEVGSVLDNTVAPGFSTFLLANTVVPVKVQAILRNAGEQSTEVHLVGVRVGLAEDDRVAVMQHILANFKHTSTDTFSATSSWVQEGIAASRNVDFGKMVNNLMASTGDNFWEVVASIGTQWNVCGNNPQISTIGVLIGVGLTYLLMNGSARNIPGAVTGLGVVVMLDELIKGKIQLTNNALSWLPFLQNETTAVPTLGPASTGLVVGVIFTGVVYYVTPYFVASIVVSLFDNGYNRPARALMRSSGVKFYVDEYTRQRKEAGQIVQSKFPMPSTPAHWASLTADLLNAEEDSTNKERFSKRMLALAMKLGHVRLVYYESFSVFAMSYTRELASYLAKAWPLEEADWKTDQLVEKLVAFVTSLIPQTQNHGTRKAVLERVTNNTKAECVSRNGLARAPLVELVAAVERFRTTIETTMEQVNFQIMKPLFALVHRIFSVSVPLTIAKSQTIDWVNPTVKARVTEITPMLTRAALADNPELVPKALSSVIGWTAFDTLTSRIRTERHQELVSDLNKTTALVKKEFKAYTNDVVLTRSVAIWMAESAHDGYYFADADQTLVISGAVNPPTDDVEITRFATVNRVVVTVTSTDVDLNSLRNYSLFVDVFAAATALEIHRGVSSATQWLSMFTAPRLTLHVNYVNDTSRTSILTAVGKTAVVHVRGLVVNEWWVDSFDKEGYTHESSLNLVKLDSVTSLRVVLNDWKLRENRTVWAQDTGLGHPRKWGGGWNLLGSPITKPNLRVKVPTKELFKNLEEWHITVAEEARTNLGDYVSLEGGIFGGPWTALPMDRFSDKLASIMLPPLSHKVTITEKSLGTSGKNLRRLLMEPNFNTVLKPDNPQMPYTALGNALHFPSKLECTWYASTGTQTGFDDTFISRTTNMTVSDRNGNAPPAPRPIDGQGGEPNPKRRRRGGLKEKVNALAIRFEVEL